MEHPRRLLVTGGAGFIGSNWVRHVLRERDDVRVVVLDALTYAGSVDNLEGIEGIDRVEFVRGDICDADLVARLASRTDAIINFAAETHVDRSIEAPAAFARTDVVGTTVLLDAALRAGHGRFIQISTDEVYGDVAVGASRETDPLAPRSPYAASKAGADLMVRAYHETHGLPAAIVRASNNFGPYQHPEKLIPLIVTNAIDDLPLPVYGDGLQQRDWLYVGDHCAAISLALTEGVAGETYNVGGGNVITNLDVIHRVLALLRKPASLIRHVTDRAGHDRRYSLDTARIRSLGWRPATSFDAALEATVRWYVDHQRWWRHRKDGAYRDYYERQYGARLVAESRRD